MSRFEIVCHAGLAILAVVVEAKDAAEAFKVARPELLALARGRRLSAMRAIHLD